MVYVPVTWLLASEMLVLPDLHTLEWTMSELLKLKMNTVPEMDPKQTSEHDGLNGPFRGDFLRRVTCCVSVLELFILYCNALIIPNYSSAIVHSVIPYLVGRSQLGASLLEIKEKVHLEFLQPCFLTILGMPRTLPPLKEVLNRLKRLDRVFREIDFYPLECKKMLMSKKVLPKWCRNLEQ